MRVFAHRGNEAFALSELQAAVLPPQWARLDERNARRRAGVRMLVSQLADVAWLRPVRCDRADCHPSYYKLAFRIDGERLSKAADAVRGEFVAAAQAAGLALDEGFRGFALRGGRRCRRVGSLANARRAAEATVLLHHPLLLEEPPTIQLVAEAIRRVACTYAGGV
jgi:dTDP-4-amino-4,6-dideoxygalactose transaminase